MRFIAFLALLYCHTLSAQQIYNRTMKLMGSRFDISVVATDVVKANAYIDTAADEITRIEKIISSWDPASQTSEINRNAGIKPIRVSAELFQLIERSIAISRLTDGAFDITYASMDKIWKFDGSMKNFPSEQEVAKSVARVGYEKIILDPENYSVFLPEEGMKIGFGAIGKGYAADKAKDLLIHNGVIAGIINASGDMNTWGKQPSGEDWKVAITNPLNKDQAFALVPITHGAVVTSGNYEKFVVFDAIRYSHIIDPRTGYPTHGIVSATVFAPSAELADALATSVFVMGYDVGIQRINQLPNIECIMIDDQGNIHTSKNININQYAK
jgi:thiamine biosynthesis lipoprotein